MILLVYFNLVNPKHEKQYYQFLEKITEADDWCNEIHGLCFIKTKHDSIYWTNQLSKYIDTKVDNLLITEITPDYSGNLSQNTWDWLNKNFQDEEFIVNSKNLF